MPDWFYFPPKFTSFTTEIEVRRLSNPLSAFSFFQLYKATADFEAGQAMYKKYSTVGERMLKERVTVLRRKQPRRLFIQCNTTANGK